MSDNIHEYEAAATTGKHKVNKTGEAVGTFVAYFFLVVMLAIVTVFVLGVLVRLWEWAV